MTDQTVPTAPRTPECLVFEDRLADYLDGTVSATERATLHAHRLACTHCHALVRDLEQLMDDAHALPDLAPARDLWAGIESQLESPAIAIPTHRAGTTPIPDARHTISLRSFAIAAAVLVAVTSGVTWRLARVQPVRGRADTPLAVATPAAPSVPTVPKAYALTRDDSIEPARAVDSVNDAPVATRLVANSPADVDDIYEREIASLRQVVNARFVDLDSVTVDAVRRNLAIIDAAIADSRRALRQDPRSRLLSTQLDRALESKLALMRRVALL